ncbi:hypothetical protein AN476_05670 [Phaeobacter sp. 11ANDIMAR09]|nr:hypothetical protein AN476_05670 [Phaeobacter sp. 11ANDIMAR09]
MGDGATWLEAKPCGFLGKEMQKPKCVTSAFAQDGPGSVVQRFGQNKESEWQSVLTDLTQSMVCTYVHLAGE